jgi:pre-rRNA-processing protein RIX1
MSLPSELRYLCHRLSSTETTSLPRITSDLLQKVIRCKVPLSAPTTEKNSSDTLENSAVLVHKLKTQISTLLDGKGTTPEGRFAAIVLVKAVVETGGWEILRGVGPWVGGLLKVLAVCEDCLLVS